MQGMQVELLAVADYANASGGKLNILGAFQVVRVAALPTRVPNLAVAVVTKSPIEAAKEERSITVRLVTPGGQIMVEVSAAMPLPTGEPEKGDRWSIAQLGINFQGVELQESGHYTVLVVGMAGDAIAQTMFRVKTVKQDGN